MSKTTPTAELIYRNGGLLSAYNRHSLGHANVRFRSIADIRVPNSCSTHIALTDAKGGGVRIACMGLLSWFMRDRPSLPRVDHPVFGPMEATLVDKDGSYFWETTDPLLTPRGAISVFLDGSIDGPSEEQVALWNWIYDNSERLARSAEPLLLDRLRDFRLEAHLGDLVWSAAGLSADGDLSGPWNMSFDLSAAGSGQDGAILTAYFKNGMPTVVSFDD